MLDLSLSAKPVIALAPMAGVTDLPFRSLCEDLGADYSVTEMAASAPQLLHSDKNRSRLQFTPRSRLKILQIIGNDARQMTDAAKYYADLGAEVIDVNLGCPMKKVHRKGAGSALLADLDKVKTILTMLTKNCPVPVTIKTRLGTDHDNYTLLNVGEIAVDLGIKQITVHGRTRACRFNGQARYDEISKLKQRFPELIVIANGDINSVDKALAVLEQTDCDGLMIGRAAVGNPWLFADIKQALYPTLSLPPRLPLETVLNHIQQIHLFYGDDKGVRFARKHIQAYLQHFRLSAFFRQLASIEQAEKQFAILKALLQTHLQNDDC